MQVWNVLHAARWKYRTQKLAKKSPSGHHHTTLSGYIFAIKARIDNWKNLLSSNINQLHMSPIIWWTSAVGPLAAEIGPVICGTPANFNGFCVWVALLHGTLVVGISQLCGVEQRAPPMFGRATITLGIGPHSSWITFTLCSVLICVGNF